jgi:hypothetical protein
VSTDRPLRDRMLNRLLGAQGWTKGDALCAGLSTSPVAIEDALADLVVDGQVEYRAQLGYRLAGTALCREAARKLKTDKCQRAVKAVPFEGGYRIGVAELRDRVGLVLYELEVPAVVDQGGGFGANCQGQVAAMVQFCS